MAVIDVDCHFEIAVPADEHPFRAIKEHLPTTTDYLCETIAGDLAQVTPAEDVPASDEIAVFMPAENRGSAEYATIEAAASEPAFESMTAEQRLGWFTDAGIDFALINPGSIGILAYHLGEHRRQAMQLANDFLAGHIGEHTNRMSPVALVDWSDLDLAVAELARMRERGSRAFWVRAEAHNRMSPAHPAWDKIWSAATDLGMIAVLHVGNAPAPYAGWGNAGWESPTGTGLGGFFRFANAMRHQAAEMMLASMVYGGVFGRHPALTVVIEELGIGWMPYFVERCDLLGFAGPWKYDRTPGEMVRQQVRCAPLPGLGDPNPITDQLAAIAEMLVFSSDYPHGEGNRDPQTLLAPTMQKMTDEQQRQFLGANIAECYARMGDPLPV
jgi:predicted TIM-barrel fold metal-dependent hydrolase